MKASFRVNFLVALFGLLFSLDVLARELINDCQSFSSPVQGSYCITKTKGSTSSDILWYLHGLGMDEKSWFTHEKNQAIADAWEAAGKDAPIVIAISFGQAWLLAENNGSQQSGLFEALVNEIMPKLEQSLGGLHGRRLLLGQSMGGFNVAQLLLKRGDLFSRVVMSCPAITTLSPYASVFDIEDYIRRTGAERWRVYEALLLGKHFYPDEASWAKAAPVELAQQVLGPQSPPVHVSCGLQDQYGFFEGAKAFADAAQSRGVPGVVWQPLEGKHCTFDPVATANFLLAK